MSRQSGQPKQTGRPPIHGGYALLAAVNGRRKIDGRSRLALALKATRDSLVRDLGAEGWGDLSKQQQMLLTRAIHKDIFCLAIEAWLLDRGTIVSRKGKLPPALGEHYLALANSLRLDLQALGLHRRARDVTPSLEEIRRRYEVEEPAGDGPAPEAAP